MSVVQELNSSLMQSITKWHPWILKILKRNRFKDDQIPGTDLNYIMIIMCKYKTGHIYLLEIL